jgi:AraC-like DNA-binding protein
MAVPAFSRPLLFSSIHLYCFGKNAGTLYAGAELNKMLSTIYAKKIIIVTQVLIYWRFHRKPEHSHQQTLNVLEDSQHTTPVSNENKNIYDHEGDQALAKQILQVLEQQKMYLQVNLKVADLARKTGGSEYRVSRIFRHHFKARDFDQFINEMCIKNASS